MKNKAVTKKKDTRKLQDVQVVNVCIKSTFNNILLAITTQSGGVLSQTSSGANSFKGPKKSTPYAAQVIAEKAREWLVSNGIKAVAIKLNGPHNTRDSAIKVLANSYFSEAKGNNGYVVTSISDITPLPHNGCRPRKIRKV
jgi:small subunit ribosomal protein S11